MQKDFLPYDETLRQFDENAYIPAWDEGLNFLIYTSDTESSKSRQNATQIDISSTISIDELLEPIQILKQDENDFLAGRIQADEYERRYKERLRSSYRQDQTCWNFLLGQPTLLIRSTTHHQPRKIGCRWILAQALLLLHQRQGRSAYYQGDL